MDPWPKLTLCASLFNSPPTVICPASETRVGHQAQAVLGSSGFGITKLPSKKNFSSLMQAPPPVPCPVGYAGCAGEPSGKVCESKYEPYLLKLDGTA